MSLHLPRLGDDPASGFPSVDRALRRPDGLLAFGGDLAPARLLDAYRHGIFPWYSPGQPILWWSPDPRTVFSTAGVHLSRRFQRSLRQSPWAVTADTAFVEVIETCAAAPRQGRPGTWIDSGMIAAYTELHALGHAHSVEVRDGSRLVGALYGVAVGRMFFGESMVSTTTGGSKVALAGLAYRLQQWGWPTIDAQMSTPHLLRMGAQARPRARFLAEV
ncbi:MAG TPA: leucyl/phenylalanyl-tRNA--protein transferase, partial [Luteimonas sp.]|nr:leucyl/phenylalanyl-tRNA--protein transferase [Luteimonas sp.]